MSCSSCDKRRKMIKKIHRHKGKVGVVKALPRIGKDIMKNPPAFIYRNGKKVNDKK